MLPLVFDDTTNKNKSKKEDEPNANANTNANANANNTPDEDEEGFKVNSSEKEDMPLKDVVVITIFQHWFDIEISSDNKS